MKKLILTVAFLAINILTFADSPLTSTPFYKAYENIEAVKHALEKGLDKTTLDFLCNKESSIVEKIAVINSLSWGNETNISIFEKYLLENIKGLNAEVFTFLKTVSNEPPAETEQTQLLTADELICWAYLQTMGDYNKPNLGMKASHLAYSRDKESMAHMVPYALMASQNMFETSWCKVYQISHTMLVETEYSKNKISDDALKIIMDYINLYKEECK
ncbi:MAG: hypothetical protein A2046_09915 [Bacteroidetes bacterium GWA2_30_7]|nr:MAG: hypothetical protein A2046_09915 [Bacteroidetes bacterium GWA2_30_7]